MATLRSRPAPHAASGSPFDYSRLFYVLLHVAGFIATTVLLTWGLLVLFLLAIGGFSLDGLMHHLANLTSRYVTADPTRVAGFKEVVGVAHLLLSAALVFFRRHALLPPARPHRSSPNVQ